MRYSYLGAWSATHVLELGVIIMSWSLEEYSCFRAWRGTQVWSLECYLGFGAWSGTQVLEFGVVLMFWSLDWYSCLELGVVLKFGAWSGTHVLELGVVLMFWSLEWCSGILILVDTWYNDNNKSTKMKIILKY